MLPHSRARALRVDGATVERPIGMANDEARGDPYFDDDVPTMQGAMVCGTQRNERSGVVVTAVGATNYVVNVEERGVSTSGNDAASAVAAQHRAPHGRGITCAPAPSPTWA